LLKPNQKVYNVGKRSIVLTNLWWMLIGYSIGVTIRVQLYSVVLEIER